MGPVVAAFDRQSRAITQSEELLIRTKQEAGRVEPLQAEVSALDQAIHTAPLYHRGATVERLTATLQQQFMAIASRDGTQVRSLRALAGPEEGTTRSISLRASLVIELGALVQLLHALDAHRPNLSIDLVEVRATPG
ncbi:MAG: hypothetical protein GY788_05155, partial [bacterium]|nr:hypothetical protein [bacterium]